MENRPDNSNITHIDIMHHDTSSRVSSTQSGIKALTQIYVSDHCLRLERHDSAGLGWKGQEQSQKPDYS